MKRLYGYEGQDGKNISLGYVNISNELSKDEI